LTSISFINDTLKVLAHSESFHRHFILQDISIMNTYAIIETGGEQLQVETGRFYDIRHLASSVPILQKQNTKIVLSRVLVVSSQSVKMLGTPWLENVIIKGRILHLRRDNKVTIYKMRAKKKTRRLQGHRQSLARFAIDSIYVNGEKISNE
jgi:large subunit ribosomal protein L21